MERLVQVPTLPKFIRTASASSACPFPFKEKEQAEVRQSLTFSLYATATGLGSILRECFTDLKGHLIGKKEFQTKFPDMPNR